MAHCRGLTYAALSFPASGRLPFSSGPGMPGPYMVHNFTGRFSVNFTAFSTNMNKM